MASLVINYFLEYTVELPCSILIVEQITFVRLSYHINAEFSFHFLGSAFFLIYKNI